MLGDALEDLRGLLLLVGIHRPVLLERRPGQAGEHADHHRDLRAHLRELGLEHGHQVVLGAGGSQHAHDHLELHLLGGIHRLGPLAIPLTVHLGELVVGEHRLQEPLDVVVAGGVDRRHQALVRRQAVVAAQRHGGEAEDRNGAERDQQLFLHRCASRRLRRTSRRPLRPSATALLTHSGVYPSGARAAVRGASGDERARDGPPWTRPRVGASPSGRVEVR